MHGKSEGPHRSRMSHSTFVCIVFVGLNQPGGYRLSVTGFYVQGRRFEIEYELTLSRLSMYNMGSILCSCKTLIQSG